MTREQVLIISTIASAILSILAGTCFQIDLNYLGWGLVAAALVAFCTAFLAFLHTTTFREVDHQYRTRSGG